MKKFKFLLVLSPITTEPMKIWACGLKIFFKFNLLSESNEIIIPFYLIFQNKLRKTFNFSHPAPSGANFG